ncbi:MAG: hypothetical protein Q9181_006243 [Wetmoreana brouardii]
MANRADVIPDIDFRDPNWTWGPGPYPAPHSPRRAAKTNRRHGNQLVWPRDKRQKGAHCWRRWKDVFTNKGPNIWVQKRGNDGPHRPQWTNWTEYNNLGYRDDLEENVQDGLKKYDFKTRKYKIPHWTDWSDVKWDRRGREPLYFRNIFGQPWIRGDMLLRQSDLEHDWDGHPFRYNPCTPHWDWFFDEKPLNWWPTTEEAWGLE